jgi:hypothetical protein
MKKNLSPSSHGATEKTLERSCFKGKNKDLVRRSIPIKSDKLSKPIGFDRLLSAYRGFEAVSFEKILSPCLRASVVKGVVFGL